MSTVNASPTVDYESFLLRLRRTNGPDAGSCRIYLHDIRDDEERYFNSLRELMAYLGGGEAGEPRESTVLAQREGGR